MKTLYLLLLPLLAKSQAPSIELQPTNAVLQSGQQTARILFHGGNSTGGKVIIHFNNQTDSVAVPQHLSEFEIPLPGKTIREEKQLHVVYRTNGRNYEARCMMSPTRQWTVYLLPHSHVDVGYTNVQEKVLSIHLNNIDEAIKIAEKTQSYPEGARFKWSTEAIWVVDNYLKRASSEKQDRFWAAVKKGWINLDGAYGNINTSSTSPAQLLHMFATGTRLAKEHGITINTMLQCDVPGFSWGLPAQSDITGIKYFLSAPNSSDRIGSADSWRDKPFYWTAPSGKEKVLFYQSSPYSIGYGLKGARIPNFFTVDDPKPYYTGNPSENFLNPYLFGYLQKLDQKGYPYDMTLLTWAMSDNAPIDPELPDAVKAWNERYASPKLVITSVKQFFTDFETKYKDKIPQVSGDYTEYWTDGISSGASETALNRNVSDRLQQASAIWAIRSKRDFPADSFDNAWTNIIMFNEHTWGAYNSVSAPNDPKVIAQWNYKKAFVYNAEKQTDHLLKQATGEGEKNGAVDVYNTLSAPRSGFLVLHSSQQVVKDEKGNILPSQQLKDGLAVAVNDLPPFSKTRLYTSAGKATTTGQASANGNTITNGIYTITVDPRTGNITALIKDGRNYADSTGLNQYTYLPGDSLEKIQYPGNVTVKVSEHGPLLAKLLITSSAPGATVLTREIALVSGEDKVRITNSFDKKAVGRKESIHFAFPFRIPEAQVRYSIPWGSINAEADQLKYANRNWYTMQRWIDVSNKDYGITLSSPDAPLFEIGPQYTTGGLLGGLSDPKVWIPFTEQSATISSWVMNNLWHTNFRHHQEGMSTFHYYLQVHTAYDIAAVNRFGLESHMPLVTAPADGPSTEALYFNIGNKNVYVENITPSRDGKSTLLQLVNTQDSPQPVNITSKHSLTIHETTLLEEDKSGLDNNFTLPGKGVMMIRVAIK